mgnify:CR=1 FL=1
MAIETSFKIILVMGFAIFVLLWVAQCQSGQKAGLKADVDAANARASALEVQLNESKLQLDAERKRFEDISKRYDDAVLMYTQNMKTAHDDHETRMEAMSNVEDEQTQDWLCDAVPADIKQLFSCE